MTGRVHVFMTDPFAKVAILLFEEGVILVHVPVDESIPGSGRILVARRQRRALHVEVFPLPSQGYS